MNKQTPTALLGRLFEDGMRRLHLRGGSEGEEEGMDLADQGEHVVTILLRVQGHRHLYINSYATD